MTAEFTYFFRNFFLTEKAVPQTFLLLECMVMLRIVNCRCCDGEMLVVTVMMMVVVLCPWNVGPAVHREIHLGAQRSAVNIGNKSSHRLLAAYSL